MANHTEQIDNSIEIVTPENIAFRYRVAGPFRRSLAYLIDLIIQGAAILVSLVGLTLVFGMLGLPEVGIGLFLTLAFLVFWFYGGFFEAYFNGQTPGKRAMQIRVLSTNGQPIGGLQAVLRNLLRTVDILPVCSLLGLFVASCNERFQRLGDLACGTMVVIEERPWLSELTRTGEPAALRIAGLIPAGFQADRTLARALAAYVQRRRHFAYGRRLEIARHLAEPLRRQFRLPPSVDLDMLLCGLYERTFITDHLDEEAGIGSSPFAVLPNAGPVGRGGLPVADLELATTAPNDIAATMAQRDRNNAV